MSVILRLVMLIIAAAIGAALWLGLSPAEAIRKPTIPDRPNIEAAKLWPAAPETAGKILGRSPFAQDRAPFNRNAGPPPAPVDVKLTGISVRGRERRASLQINGQRIVVGVGDSTPAGVVDTIEEAAVTLAGPPERRVEMFKQ